ncbi:hypothetical protein VOLCADRAFT_87131 [Volvox carteri f. nagariensis]|uniref:Peptidase S8/S53 domain-containing protein n=1 Tax=Volvox carteri f. nagariensis TaxID=3068 RepID=D8TK92_VOLCA|nr:uncharacterized protein VOLCADRAFT_87131 [Volvox carteri f. nagariensis]EFJ52209.1 hypothetical protein VOLCADRAFT_87131 [Volvox carteri f. nagariensis]|eukprot:XP_002946983.1 hypothetical protein VOLCADRAFT_87131 [Volvox carteri f. nagariensis]
MFLLLATRGVDAVLGNMDLTRYRNLTGDLRPYWKAGIVGNDVVIGVADTGIDMGHCSFVDDAYDPLRLQSLFTNRSLSVLMSTHRKVVQYTIPPYAQPDFFGDLSGHGTHVCGTIAGAKFSSATGDFLNSVDTGAAPAAKISFMDTAKNGNQLYIPSIDYLLQTHYNVGARLSSDSWGTDGASSVVYDYISQAFDLFAWRNPGFLSMIAAGNAVQIAHTLLVVATVKYKQLTKCKENISMEN